MAADAKRPAIGLLSGNLGNRLFQYFAAESLLQRVGGGDVSGIHFREWNIQFPTHDPSDFRRILFVGGVDEFDPDILAGAIWREPSTFIINRSHLQRQNLYLPKSHYSALLPFNAGTTPLPDDALLINIRTGDLLTGHAKHYPLTPVQYYQDVVRRTGMTPVFLGQFDAGPYMEALRSAFPNASFIESRGARADFDTIRQARHIVPAVSTFSLAAAWLSDAVEIHLPVNGFLNPSHFPEIDLLPIGDGRYYFDLFPLNFALPEIEALRHHETIAGSWRRVSHEQLRLIRDSRPFMQRPAGQAQAKAPGWFDEVSYVHGRLEAAVDISHGWFSSGYHHFLASGRTQQAAFEGRQLRRFPNLALGNPAWQSSRSRWSRGRNLADDAGRAVDGNPSKDYGFHTDMEDCPWWMVDCQYEFHLREIRLYNRKGPSSLQDRLSRFRVEVSRNSADWSVVSSCCEPFGKTPHEMTPHVIAWSGAEIMVRYVRIVAEQRTYLHLAEVEVYGIPA